MAKDQLRTALTELLGLCEQLYLERCVLEVLVKESDAHWLEKYNRALCDPRLRGRTHAMFERAALLLKQTNGYEESSRALMLAMPVARRPN